MPSSTEMRQVIPATMQDVYSAEERISKNITESERRFTQRQEDYETRCENDRKALRGEVESVKTIISRVEEKTDVGNKMVEPIANAFKGFLSQPKVQAAMLSALLSMMGVFIALAGYAINRIHEITPQPQPQPAKQVPQIIVIPQSALDGGAPSSITVQTQ